jgi:hypothetical protein
VDERPWEPDKGGEWAGKNLHIPAWVMDSAALCKFFIPFLRFFAVFWLTLIVTRTINA